MQEYKRGEKMADRTFGWVQEAYTIENLKKVVSLFVLDSEVNKNLRFDKIPRLISEANGREMFLTELNCENMEIPYIHLKGRGTPKGFTRSNAPCTGIVQAALPGQRKEYQSDWPADSFLRWAVSIGFLNYDREADTCSLTEMGRSYAEAETADSEEYEILTQAFISYPPVCRILTLLDINSHMTKFEIGSQLGFIGEAGFTSIPQEMIVRGLAAARTREEKVKLLQDTEGTSDKYVRTICSWLKQMDWIIQTEKEIIVFDGKKKFSGVIGQAYKLTLKGKKALRYSSGSSSYKKVPKRVMWDMLATKGKNRDYLRCRRAHIIKYINKNYRTILEIQEHLKIKGIQESETVIRDDLAGFVNIGLNIRRQGDGFTVSDDINGLDIPAESAGGTLMKTESAVLKDRLRERLVNVNHKYLALLDLGFDGNSDRDYEMLTAELFTSELGFSGARLGDSRKPDVCVYYGNKGLIIDNKAYSKGYSLPIKQADEMYRYIEENQLRDRNINANEWWNIFDSGVDEFCFLFVSGAFTGGFKERINNIFIRSGVRGAAVSSENLLLLAEEISSGRVSRKNSFELFGCNDEINIKSGYADDLCSMLQKKQEITG